MYKRWFVPVAVSLLMIFALLVTGCPNEDGGEGGESSVSSRDLFEAVCQFYDRCPDNDFFFPYRTVAECVQLLDTVLTCDMQHGADGRPSLERKALNFEQSAGRACLEWLNEASCQDYDAEDTPCDHVFDADEGQEIRAADGESCYDMPCQDGLQCTYLNGAGVGECPICLGPAQAGESCVNPYRECAEGLLCDWNEEVCRPLGDVGDECYDWNCREDLRCDYTNYECVELLADGQECYDHYSCQSGFCDFIDYTCKTGGEAGDPCETHAECITGICDMNAEVWVCIDYAQPGEPCEEDYHCDYGYCDEGTNLCGRIDGETCNYREQCQSEYCDSSNYTCQPKKELGQDCIENSECESGACDYWNSRVCVAECDAQGQCESGHYCDGSYCIELLDDEAQCDYDGQCASGLCQSWICSQPPQFGDACSHAGDCPARGYCDEGICEEQKWPGEACSGQASCIAPSRCLDEVCVAIPLQCSAASVGEHCSLWEVCDDSTFCDVEDDYRCAPRLEAGEVCTAQGQCVEGHYCDQSSFQPICAEMVADGDSCTQHAACSSGYCDNDICAQPAQNGGEPQACVMP